VGNAAEKFRPALPDNEDTLAVTLTVGQMRQVCEESAARALDAHVIAEWTDQKGIGAFLQLSWPTIKKLCDEGMPHTCVGDARRFHIKTVNAWMLARTPTPRGRRPKASNDSGTEDP
jgi:hypothetical protein